MLLYTASKVPVNKFYTGSFKGRELKLHLLLTSLTFLCSILFLLVGRAHPLSGLFCNFYIANIAR